MTDTNDARDDARTDAQTLADVDHTHPDTGRTFGGNFTFARGGAIAADGGRPDVFPEDGPETLRDVDHTPPEDGTDANRVFERGEEGRPDDGDGSGRARDGETVAEDE